jgi:hypothetical protein
MRVPRSAPANAHTPIENHARSEWIPFGTVRADVDCAGIAEVTVQEPMLHREALLRRQTGETACEELDRHG